MKRSNEFLIPFIGLKIGKHEFDYHIERSFFDEYGFDEFDECNIQASVLLDKKGTFLELKFKHKGTVTVPCDVTGAMFELPIKGSMRLVVQFGDTFNNDHDEILILPQGEYQVDVAQYVYEMIALSIPLKRVSPEGKEQQKLASKTEKPKKEKKEDKNTETDPRWDTLKQLLTNKK
jgi:uncharacterized metal-binding protein YceD (DUF177 family)